MVSMYFVLPRLSIILRARIIKTRAKTRAAEQPARKPANHLSSSKKGCP